jgi:ATP-dependent Clp protease protease subunit
MALPNSRILIHQPATEGGYGQSTDMEIQAREILRMRTAMEVILARHTGNDEEKIRRDIERDKFLAAEEAKEYGLIDEVLTMLKRGTDRAVEVVSSLPEGYREDWLFPTEPRRGLMVTTDPRKRYRR